MTEADKARAWRKARGLTIKELADLTGFNRRSITAYEGGFQPDGGPISPVAMRRFRLACAAIDHGLEDFDWKLEEPARRKRSLINREKANA